MGRKIVLLAVVLVAATQFLAAQTTPSLQGAWRVTETIVTGDGAEVNKAPQPGLIIFTKQHYSMVLIDAPSPRKDFGVAANPNKLTDAEKLARFEAWDVLTANSGTYQLKGNTLTTRPLVAKNPAVMTGPAQNREFKIEGNTLTLVLKSPAGVPAWQETTRLTRIE